MPHHVLSDARRIHYEVRPGDDPPIVLLHGILESSEVWTRVADDVTEAGRSVLLVDDRGHGASSPWYEGMLWAPAVVADDVASLLDAVAPEGAHVVGASRGGTAASWLAAERPDLVRSLAVVASPPQMTEVFRAHFRKELEALPEDAPERTRAALAYLAKIPEEDFPMHALRRYRGRALVVEVGDDPLYSPVNTMFWRLFLPYADFERLDEGGHDFFHQAEGAAWLTRRLLEHVAKVEQGAPDAM